MDYIKYPRTYHLPTSPGVTADDKINHNTKALYGQAVVITEKMDGENTTIYSDGCVTARSLDSANHPSRTWVRSFAATFCHDIPEGYRICGENVFAQHSIPYINLSSYFLAFSIWNGEVCLTWKDTTEFCELLGIDVVPVLFKGILTPQIIKELSGNHPSVYGDMREGFVIRPLNSFSLSEFSTAVVKYVRANHVQTSDHWMSQKIIQNKLVSL